VCPAVVTEQTTEQNEVLLTEENPTTPVQQEERVDRLIKSPSFSNDQDIEEPIRVTPQKHQSPVRERESVSNEAKPTPDKQLTLPQVNNLANGNTRHKRSDSKASTGNNLESNRTAFQSKSPQSSFRQLAKTPEPATKATKDKKIKYNIKQLTSQMIPGPKSNHFQNIKPLRNKNDKVDYSLNLSTIDHDDIHDKEVTFRKRSVEPKRTETLDTSMNPITDTSIVEPNVNDQSTISANNKSLIQERKTKSVKRPATAAQSTVGRHSSEKKKPLVKNKSIGKPTEATSKVEKKNPSGAQLSNTEITNSKKDLLIDVHPPCPNDELDINLLKRLQKNLRIIDSNMVSYKTLSVQIKIFC